MKRKQDSAVCTQRSRFIALLILFLCAGVSFAQSYPAKPIRIIVPVGPGTLQHLATELFAATAGISLVHVPYKGLGAAFPDLLSNRIQMTMSSITSLVPHIRSKALRPLAVTSAQRTRELPELPTMTEAGVRRFVVTQWHGLLAPAGTPRPLLERLHREVVKAVLHPEIVARLERDGTEPIGSSPGEFAFLLKEEHVKWSRVITQTGLRVE